MRRLLLAAALAGVAAWLLWPTPAPPGALVLFVAASQEPAVRAAADRWSAQAGVAVELRVGGSQTLLTQLRAAPRVDLFVPADDSYLEPKDGWARTASLGTMRAVVASRPASPVRTWAELVAPGRRVAVARPDLAAIGKRTRESLDPARRAELGAVTVAELATVNDVTAAVALGSADAGLVWDVVARGRPDLFAAELPELANVTATAAAALHPRAAPRAGELLDLLASEQPK